MSQIFPQQNKINGTLRKRKDYYLIPGAIHCLYRNKQKREGNETDVWEINEWKHYLLDNTFL